MLRKLLKIYNSEGFYSIILRVFFKLYSVRKKIFINYIFRHFYYFMLRRRKVFNLTNKDFKISKEEKEKIIKLSTIYMNHNFYIFSEIPYKLNYPDSNRISWRTDHRSGYTWDNSIYYSKVSYGDTPGIDVKVPWELSRMLFLPTLALAARFNDGEEYCDFIKKTLIDFDRDNPFLYGVNWKCTMDVSIRLINILVTNDLTKSMLKKSCNNLDIDLLSAKHYLYIIHNLEWVPFNRGNHYYSNLVAILVYLRYTKSTNRRVLKKFINEFLNETSLQFNEDGTNFEASTTYHCLSFELFMIAFSCCKHFIKNDQSLLCNKGHMAYAEILQSKGAKFISDVHAPDGSILQIGDNDSGYVLELEYNKYSDETLKRNYLDYRHLAKIEPTRLNLYKRLEL